MKKILLSLFVGLIGLINFGYCLDFYDPFEDLGWNKLFTLTGTINPTSSYTEINVPTRGNYCYVLGLHYVGSNDYFAGIDFTKSAYNGSSSFLVTNETMISPGLIGCLPNLMGFGIDQGYKGDSYEYIINMYSMDNPKNCSQYTSLECQQEYDLLPVSSVDQNYCVNNGFCPSGGGDCPIGTGDNWSALYINDIQHLGKPIINITFPDYLDWDYTTTENEFNLDIVGYPVDTEYIDGIIRTQNYKPTSEDFTQLVGMLAPYSKYLLFLLFIFIIWAWIKKPFKSKKL